MRRRGGIEQDLVRFLPGVVTRGQKIATGLDRHWRGNDMLILRFLPPEPGGQARGGEDAVPEY